MASKKLREPKAASDRPSVTADASFWLQKFVEDFERSFLNESLDLPANADIADLHQVTIQAMVHTLIDSGMTSESLIERLGETVIAPDGVNANWSPKLNKRRLKLIDKQIQQSITQAEQIELAGLTSLMRKHTDSELNLPIEGARALHKRLLDAELRNQHH